MVFLLGLFLLGLPALGFSENRPAPINNSSKLSNFDQTAGCLTGIMHADNVVNNTRRNVL